MKGANLTSHYASLQETLPLVERPDYAQLVVPNGNATAPIHRWFHLKEGFSCRLLSQILIDANLEHRSGLTLLDPFVGSGTSIVSAATLGETFGAAYGIEVNPFLHLVAKTKSGASSDDFDELLTALAEILRVVTTLDAGTPELPGLSTFSNPLYFPAGAVHELLRLRAAIEVATEAGPSRDLAMLALAATVEPVSKLRRDGRALRYEPGKTPAAPYAEFLRRAAMSLEDLKSQPRRELVVSVALGDGRRPKSTLPAGVKADLVLFSPPYPNNIDYTEVYKLESWLLQFIRNAEDFKAQRLKTVRSHPSVLFPETYGSSRNGHQPEFDSLISPLLAAIPSDRYASGRRQLIEGYFDDMLTCLEHLADVTERNGRVVYVVGNSIHGVADEQFVIAADVLIATLARLVGLEVQRVMVARRPTRRSYGAAWVRESVVILRQAGDC